ncbi:tyrosine-type recombinase/integrase [Leucobacter chromiireducens]|uniref:Site-specific integrase n=1 Tax=Leucobacter chromiireducens subsp. solipictus TaxID=398235 RepID=A0ABS1SED1_9MICO|nr:site-specific integrase [Leucobacter chromiireducens]MBL3678900.1 site-specific integrase [Leucobacter chromiireducens subsp. solipictus]
MARPRTPIGTFGKISHRRLGKGRCEARARYRDWDGKLRAVQCRGLTRAAAELALKRKLAERSLFQPGFIGISSDSRFSALVDYWLEDMEIEDRLSKTTRQLYERNMRTLVAPVFAELTLREIGVARCDYFLKQLAKQSYNRARQARVVLRLALGLAVRHEVIPRNPMDHVSRLRRPVSTPDAFEDSDIELIREAVQAWEEREITAGPRPDGQLGQIIEVLLGTSARIGEVLAIRLCDLDLRSPIPTVKITGTIVSRKGELTHRQDHPKTSRSVRRIALPAFAMKAIKARMKKRLSIDPDALLFCNRNGGPMTTNNVRRQLRSIMDKTGLEGVTPHRFRRTGATTIYHAGGLDLAAGLLGHTDPRITQHHYIARNDLVDPATASMLEQRFGG